MIASVWELKRSPTSQAEGPQLGIFTLRVGSNPAQLPNVFYGTYEVIEPRQTNAFNLKKDGRYQISVWGLSGRLRDAVVEFR